MQSHSIQSFCYAERHTVLPHFATSLSDCGGWVIDRKTLSASTIEFRIEIQLSAVLDLYAAILATGVELTRAAHLTLNDLCTCRKYLPTTADLGQVVALRIELNFLDDVTLHSLLSSLAPPA